MQMLKGIGIEWRESRFIIRLHGDQSVKPRLDQGETAWRLKEEAEKGAVFHCFYSTYSEYLTKAALEGLETSERRNE